jgi:hypothetical protein
MAKLSFHPLFVSFLICALVATGVVALAAPAHAANGQAVVTRTTIQTSEKKNTQELEVLIGGILGSLVDVTAEFTYLHLEDTSPANTSSSTFYTGTSSYAQCPNGAPGVKSTNSVNGSCKVQNSTSTSIFHWQGYSGYQGTGDVFAIRFPAGSLTFGSQSTAYLSIRVDNVSVGFVNLTELPLAPQAALSLTSTSGTFGNPLTLITSGGSGSGALTYSTSNGTASDCSINGGSLSSGSAGTCQVTATKSADSNYAAASSSPTTVSIGLASRALSFGATTTYPLAYGATQTVTATPSAGAGDGAVTYSVSAGTACSVNASTGEIRVTEPTGSCSVSASITQGTNYQAASTTTQVVVNGTVKAITITGGSPSVNFGTTYFPSALDISNALVFNQLLDYLGATFTYTGINGTSYPSTTTAPTDAGIYLVLPSNVVIETGANVDKTANYNISYAPGTLAISKVSRTLTFTSTSYSLAYGDNQTVVANASAGDGIVTYSEGASTACTVDPSNGVVTITDSSGSCSLTANIATGTNHLAVSTTTPVTVAVSARPITITASSPTATVGGSFSPSFSVSTGTLVDSDAISGVAYQYAGTGSTSYTSSTTAPTAIGTYSITPFAPIFSTGSSTNYAITFVVGTLTISNKLSRTLSFMTTSYTLEYGDTHTARAAVSGGPFDGTVTYSDGFSTACSVDASSGLIEVTSGTGTCVVSAEISEGVQYLGAITTTPVTVTVEPRALTVTARNQTVPFGSAITPEFETTQGILQNSDAISGVSYNFAGTGSTSFVSSTTAPTGGGTYSATPSAAVFSTGLAANYAITYVAANLTIEQDAVPYATMTIDSPVGARILGSTLAYSASGMQPSARYEITIRSTPQILSSGVTTNGSISGTTNIPSKLEAGWHTLTFVSTAADGLTFTESMYIKVSSSGILLSTSTDLPADLAHTGAGVSSLALVATVTLMLGLAIIRMTRRNPHKRRG